MRSLLTTPNSCSSECAGRVLVAIRSARRRIAERFRYLRSIGMGAVL
jgi:hypothetical protein